MIVFGSAPILLYSVFPVISGVNTRFGYNFEARIPDTEVYLTSADFDSMQQVLNAIAYVQDHGHSFGHQVFSAFLFFIPRAIWEGKAIPTGELVGTGAGYVFLNLSAPLFAELYVDFSLVGVAIGFFVLGIVLRKLDLAITEGSSFGLLLISVVCAALLPGVLRGSLLGILPFVASVAFWILVPIFVSSLYRRRSSLAMSTLVPRPARSGPAAFPSQGPREDSRLEKSR